MIINLLLLLFALIIDQFLSFSDVGAGGLMRVLIVESHFELGCLWERALQRNGADVCFARSQPEAVKALMQDDFDIIVLDLVLKNGSAFAISDFANYRRPKARVVFVTNTSFF